MKLTRKKFVAEAREWLGTEYLDQQSAKQVGADCVGFVAGVARNTGAAKDLTFETSYRRADSTGEMVRLFREYMDEINWRDAQPADFFVTKRGRDHWHCMIVTERQEDIETEFTVIEAGPKKVVEHRIDAGMKRHIHSAYRIRGIK
jgi:cell wall-associated NlpC family hydrolase